MPRSAQRHGDRRIDQLSPGWLIVARFVVGRFVVGRPSSRTCRPISRSGWLPC
ncbi:MAG: hypothetical protein J2P15_17930 [Micromonosporaceae bacterium]|nr:hypothetical protein [Micromonosporaceae bacterium]